MNYLSLYRKYRPKTWDDVIGQEYVVKTLINQISQNNISHAYLFTGSRGTGKTSSAKIFARAVNCSNPINGSPCNTCPICQSILNEASMDIIEIDGASNNSVDDIRALIENIMYPPTIGKYKVYIIDEVHMLSVNAFNAFLKTLEEPPSYVIFVLATTEVHKIPNTILSRCMRFDFRLISTDLLTNFLATIFEKESYTCEQEACRMIAVHGQGSARDTLSIADMCMAYAPNKLTAADVLEVLGASDFDTLFELSKHILENNLPLLLKSIDGINSRGKGISTLNRELANFFRDLITLKNVDNHVIFAKKEQEKAKSLARAHDNYKLIKILENIATIENSLKYSSQPHILFEATLIRAASLIADPSFEAVNSRLNTLEKKLSKAKIEKNQYEDNGNQTLEEKQNLKSSVKPKKEEKKPTNDNSVASSDTLTDKETNEIDVNPPELIEEENKNTDNHLNTQIKEQESIDKSENEPMVLSANESSDAQNKINIADEPANIDENDTAKNDSMPLEAKNEDELKHVETKHAQVFEETEVSNDDLRAKEIFDKLLDVAEKEKHILIVLAIKDCTSYKYENNTLTLEYPKNKKASAITLKSSVFKNQVDALIKQIDDNIKIETKVIGEEIKVSAKDIETLKETFGHYLNIK